MKREYAQWLVLSGLLVLCFAAAALGGQFTSVSVNDWYPTLEKPSWRPPSSVFAPVWTVLYASMAIAAWMVWHRRGFGGAKVAFVVFGIQLLLNVAWSAAFFGARSPMAGFAVIVMLWWAILATLLAFWRIHRVAGVLLMPYLAWVTFAAALNYSIWQMNPA